MTTRNELQVTARLKIHQGQLEAFKKVARACMESVRTKDTGTLQYDWFFNADETECVVRETYVSSDAVLECMGNLGEVFGQLFGTADLSLEVYEMPSEKLLAATDGMGIVYYAPFQSFHAHMAH